LDRVAQSDIIILGEQHNDAMGHAVERSIVADTVERWPATTLTMEMLERDDQPLVDDYFDEIITVDQFRTMTRSSAWGGPGGWVAWYQPIIDAVRHGGGRLVAANAPRRYVRLARTDGYDRLRALPASRRAFFEIPVDADDDAYHTRFRETMAGVHPEEDEAEKIDALYRSQLVWDATMAASIAEAFADGAAKVVHVVGQFHCDFQGGTVQQLRARTADASIMVISLQPAAATALREEDRGRADAVIYTGG
ncbi:MAG: ChaN family lipoprotein, partial [Phycisphaerales bacterium]|nr:ChaN family lipoprotein [Phycisphaerales bacterium]